MKKLSIMWLMCGCIGASAADSAGNTNTPAVNRPQGLPASYAVNLNRGYRDKKDYNVTGALGPDAAFQTNWNNLHSPVSVNDNGGQFTATITDSAGQRPIKVRFSGANVWGNDGKGDDTSDLTRLFSTGCRAAGRPEYIKTDTAPFPGTYDVYAYFGGGGGVSCTVNGSPHQTFKNPQRRDDFEYEGNFMVFTGLTGPMELVAHDSLSGFSIVAQATPYDNHILPVGLILPDGFAFAAEIISIEDDKVNFRRPGAEAESLPLTKLAVLLFQSMSDRKADMLKQTRPGLLLNSLDFLEGEPRGLANGKLSMSSVLFGLHTFNVADQAIALVLRPTTRRPSAMK